MDLKVKEFEGVEVARITNPRQRDKVREGVLSKNIPDLPFYFHANHLGSGSLITDKGGGTYQTLAYAPYGEELINIRHVPGNYDEKYRFTGHHKDEESGAYYMGARYNFPELNFTTSPEPKFSDYPNIIPYAISLNNPIRYIDPDGNAAVDALGDPPDNFYQLPSNPANIDTKVWEVYTPERHTGHDVYWRNRENGAMLTYDKAGDHYHLYKDTKFKVRIDAEGTMSGTKLSKGSSRFHIKSGAKINLSATTRSMSMGMGVFSVFSDLFKIFTGSPDGMFNSFNPDGNFNTCYGLTSPNNVSQNLYYEITGKSKDGNTINVNFYENYYYDHDSKRYRGTGEYMKGIMKKEEKGYRLCTPDA
jgi:RHS repeat-associated protein